MSSFDNQLFKSQSGQISGFSNNEEIIAQTRAKQLNLTYVDLKNLSIEENTISLLPLNEAEEFQMIPFSRSGRVLKIAAVLKPLGAAKTRLVRLSQQSGYEIEVVIVSPTSLNYALRYHAKIIEKGLKEKAAADQPKQRPHQYLEEVKTVADVVQKSKNINTTELLEILIAGAVNTDASDIHIEPQKDHFTIRYRLDGVLYDIITFSHTLIHSLISRIKINAGMKLDQNQIAQDSSFERKYGNIFLDLRVSTMPTQYGESIVMRLARSDKALIPVEDLGFSAHDRERIEKASQKAQGVIIASGPTGSGKTTTLYAIINSMNSSEKKIITLEDPIEYHLEGIEQSQIFDRKKFGFAQALKAVLRQDPNIVMVGEIRDHETAEVAFEAALTGHLVLTTMHATSATHAFIRLIDLGVKTNLLGGSINLVINQRLIRRICPDCRGAKCINCHKIGYKGRIAVAETLAPTPDFERALIAHRDFASLVDLAKQNGMKLLFEDGQEKVSCGITTAEEVMRVT